MNCLKNHVVLMGVVVFLLSTHSALLGQEDRRGQWANNLARATERATLQFTQIPGPNPILIPSESGWDSGVIEAAEDPQSDAGTKSVPTPEPSPKPSPMSPMGNTPDTLPIGNPDTTPTTPISPPRLKPITPASTRANPNDKRPSWMVDQEQSRK